MHFFSTTNSELKATFREALLSGLAPDGGLYVPSGIPEFTDQELEYLATLSFSELAAQVTRVFVGDEIPEPDIDRLCAQAYDFPITLQAAGNDLFLELFHGPTAAFKDIAGQFMGHAVSYFLQKKSLKRNILVATSGDTGGAIGAGFQDLPGVKVFILFPRGGVSSVQRQQLCTMGGNIQAIEIEGSFDDCQSLVKQAFADRAFNDRFNLMSANSINVGRVIPQSFYYLWASLQLQKKYPNKNIIFSVPSGNLGNITGAYLAKKMGAPIHHLIVANNINNPFVELLHTGEFRPRPSIHTLSNAMDIGHPNNYYRINYFLPGGAKTLNTLFSGYSFTDQETADNLATFYRNNNYLMCPHTSVGHLATQTYKELHPEDLVVTVATAHSAKFKDEVAPIIGKSPILPPTLARIMAYTPEVDLLTPTLDELKSYLQTKI